MSDVAIQPLRTHESLYRKLVMNQHDILHYYPLLWIYLNEGPQGWKLSEHLITESLNRKQIEEGVYELMEQDGFKPPKLKHPDHMVRVYGEKYSRIWLVHYYNLRHFQPCRQVSSFVASRLTGEYHEGNKVSDELDLARLCKARKILDQEAKS